MKTKHDMLEEASRLYSMGFSILWLRPKEKRPVEAGWTKGNRKSWEELKASYRLGYNIGVRTGSPSQIGKNYLACIDIDIKEPTDSAKLSAWKVVSSLTKVSCPTVHSGSGNGSAHLYCVTSAPFKMITVADNAQFQICIYSDNRQMVLPPSIHPSGKAYVWDAKASLQNAKSLPLIDFSQCVSVLKAKTEKKQRAPITDTIFEAVEWKPFVSKETAELIEHATFKGVPINRSDYLLMAATRLFSAGLDDREVIAVLTDPTLALGMTAYDHAQTNSRAQAASWLWKYTIEKVKAERDAMRVFKKAHDYPVEAPLEGQKRQEQSSGIEAARDWKQDIKRSGKGEGPPVNTLQNVLLILQNAVSQKLVKRDLFAYRDTYGCNTPWGGLEDALVGDDDVVSIRVWLSRNWRFEPSKESIYDALTFIACANAFDPIKDWLDQLPGWDGTKRLDSWLLEHFAAQGEAEYLAQVFRKWLVAMVGRVYEPGLKFDWMPIFEGAQGVGKSSFGRLLVGEEYFLDWLPNLADKDSALSLQGTWGVEMGELATMRKNEIEVVKAFITRTIDRVRPPFGRKTQEILRRCVFYGTTNRDTYLRDDTGNRRFKPVVVGGLDFAALERDRVQLFAEAKWLWDNFIENEQTLNLEGSARDYESVVQKQKLVEDDSAIMAEEIDAFFEKQEKTGIIIPPVKFKLLALFEPMGPLASWNKNNRNVQFAARALKSLQAGNWLVNGRKYWKYTKYYTFGTIR